MAGWRRVASRLVVGVCIVVALPFALEGAAMLYGGGRAAWFAHKLSVGMSSSLVDEWRTTFGGSAHGTLNSGTNARIDESGSHVWFTTGGIPCMAWGSA